MFPLRASVVRPFSFVILPSLFFFVFFVPFVVPIFLAVVGCAQRFPFSAF